MARTILVVDDEPTLRETLVEALEADGFRVVVGGRRPRGADPLPGRAPGPRPARPDAPRAVRDRGLPDHPGRVGRADRHADGQGLRARQGRRARARRRRLRHQAVQPARADGPDPGALPAVRAGRRGRRAARGRRPRARSRPTWAATGCCATARSLPIKPKAFELLAFLIRHPGQVFTRDQLLEHVWGYDYAGETRTVDVHVHWLRSRIEADPGQPGLHPHGPRRRLRVPPPDLTAPLAPSVRLVVHPLDRLGGVLGGVDRVLEVGVEVAPLDDLDRRRARRGRAAPWPPATARRPRSRARGPPRSGARGPSARRACGAPRRARRPARRGSPPAAAPRRSARRRRR